jgi:2-methylcitrate synthase
MNQDKKIGLVEAKNSVNNDLDGIVAGTTNICRLCADSGHLSFRGYSVADLVSQGSFEETAHLLLYKKLPNASELNQFIQRLCSARHLPVQVRQIIERLPIEAHPMDVLRTAVSAMGCIEPELDDDEALRIGERLIASMPAIVAYWYHFHHMHRRVDTFSEESKNARYFLSLLQEQSPSPHHAMLIDRVLILYSEHEFNASTFAARIAAATKSDIYASVVSAISTLSGSLHGGANEAAMSVIEQFDSPEQVEERMSLYIEDDGSVPGFGHNIYRHGDPRIHYIKKHIDAAAINESSRRLLSIAQAIEMYMRERHQVYANLDFYAAVAFKVAGVPNTLFTPMFVMSRIAGWTAHVIEQRELNQKLRPIANYTGPQDTLYVPIAERQ